MGSRILTVCFGGKWKKEEDVWVFVSKKSSKAFVIDKDTSFEGIKSKIVERFHVDIKKNNITLSHLHPNHKEIEPFRIDEDEDLQAFFKINEMSDVAWSLSLYVVLETLGSGSTTDVELNKSFVKDVAQAVYSSVDNSTPSEVNIMDLLGSEELNIDESIADRLDDHCEAGDGQAADKCCNHLVEESHDVEKERPEAEEEEEDFYQSDGIEKFGTNLMSVHSDGSTVEKGQIFSCKQGVHDALSKLAVREKFEFRVKKSTKSLWVVGCTDVSCKWRLRATRLENSNYFEIRKYTGTHSCTLANQNTHHRRVSYKLIARMIRERYDGVAEGPTPLQVQNLIRTEMGTHVSYWKAHAARRVAQKMIRGTATQAGSQGGCVPPLTRRPRGRPKISRISSVGETPHRKRKCGMCGLRGHNKKTCKNQPVAGTSLP